MVIFNYSIFKVLMHVYIFKFIASRCCCNDVIDLSFICLEKNGENHQFQRIASFLMYKEN